LNEPARRLGSRAKRLLRDVVLKPLSPFRNVTNLPRDCNICGYSGLFQPSGHREIRIDALCPSCLSVSRQRSLKLYIDATGIVSGDDTVLHFAPERCVTRFLRPLAKRYVTADYLADGVDLRLDIEAMDLDDASFTRIVCSHVLEHVDDRRALAEMLRVLAPDGVALLMVPIVEGWETTYENPEVVTEIERELHFNQSDHIRFYGRDFRERVREAGFELTEFSASPLDCVRFSLTRGETVFVARKPAG
jgi:SAM-dependent methyltransferase